MLSPNLVAEIILKSINTGSTCYRAIGAFDPHTEVDHDKDFTAILLFALHISYKDESDLCTIPAQSNVVLLVLICPTSLSGLLLNIWTA
jgi:hypothetical protein